MPCEKAILEIAEEEEEAEGQTNAPQRTCSAPAASPAINALTIEP